jgi:hypothetical protein
LKYEKCIHPASIGEIGKHQDPRVRRRVPQVSPLRPGIR